MGALNPFLPEEIAQILPPNWKVLERFQPLPRSSCVRSIWLWFRLWFMFYDFSFCCCLMIATIPILGWANWKFSAIFVLWPLERLAFSHTKTISIQPLFLLIPLRGICKLLKSPKSLSWTVNFHEAISLVIVIGAQNAFSIRVPGFDLRPERGNIQWLSNKFDKNLYGLNSLAKGNWGSGRNSHRMIDD